MVNTETLHDEDVAAFIEEHHGERIAERWLEVLDREPEEKWLELANSFFASYRVKLKAVGVELKDNEFYWEVEVLG